MGEGVSLISPRLKGLSEKQREAIVQPQEVSLKSWAEMWGMNYLKITSREYFDELEGGEKTLLVELIPDSDQDQLF